MHKSFASGFLVSTTLLLATLGALFAFFTSATATGYVISDALPQKTSFFIALACMMFALFGAAALRTRRQSSLEQEVGNQSTVITSSVKQDAHLYRFAQELQGRERTQTEINHLIAELSKGNKNPGLGSEHLNDAGPVMYARGRNGGRVFYIPHGKSGYKIIGYADKNNEDRVIKYLRGKYNRH
ncbi:MAG: hypothetical protein AABX53_03680 [Nanoarchaeota archaeon]